MKVIPNPIPKVPTDKLELATCVDLLNIDTVATPQKPSKPNFHFIYASELYGSLFGLYGRFVSEVLPGIPEDEQRYVKTIQLRLFTYTGVLNIGFATYVPTYDKSTLTFGVQGNSGEDEKMLEFEPGELVVPKKKPIRLTFERLLFPLVGSVPTEPPTAELGTPNQGKVLFDTEFYFRNGAAHTTQYRRGGMATQDDEKNVTLPKAEMKIVIPAMRCLSGEVNLYYS